MMRIQNVFEFGSVNWALSTMLPPTSRIPRETSWTIPARSAQVRVRMSGVEGMRGTTLPMLGVASGEEIRFGLSNVLEHSALRCDFFHASPPAIGPAMSPWVRSSRRLKLKGGGSCIAASAGDVGFDEFGELGE
jgi:hypothetical protein